MKKCIFLCVFNNKSYIHLLNMLLYTLFSYGNLKDDTDVLIYTSTYFMNIIKNSPQFRDCIKFEINDTYNSVDTACKSRLDLFKLNSISEYCKILYLDTDILIRRDINLLFDAIEEELLYALEEGVITHELWGRQLFGDEINNYEDKTAFNSGVLGFKNCKKIKNLFQVITDDALTRKSISNFYDQPFFVYNAIHYGLCNKTMMKKFVILNCEDVNTDKTILHFCGDPGITYHKQSKMERFINKLNEL